MEGLGWVGWVGGGAGAGRLRHRTPWARGFAARALCLEAAAVLKRAACHQAACCSGLQARMRPGRSSPPHLNQPSPCSGLSASAVSQCCAALA